MAEQEEIVGQLLELLQPAERDPSSGYEFVGVQSCQSCHQKEFDDWKKSHHAVAMQDATPETVLGDFDDAEFVHFGRMTRFFRKGEEFWINAEDSDGARKDFPVKYTFGVYPLQQYLIPFPGGRLQALTVCWDSRSEEEGGQRWYHLYPDEEIPPEDELHWTRRHFNWNYMCADCHSTNVDKGYDLEENTYNTTYSEIQVSCEACHGPGSEHVAWAQGGRPEASDFGLLERLKESKMATWVHHPETGQPTRSHPLEDQAQLETCAPCHAHRQPLQKKRLYGQKLDDVYRASVLDRVHYHADGQIKEEVYVYGSFVQSKMFHKGVRCTDCHQPHTMELYATDNNLCNRCHQPLRYDTPEHHHHPVGSAGASCVECHMPPKYYMVVDKRRDHSIRIPRPDLSVQYGTPNACSVCHQGEGETVAWAAEAFEEWYGPQKKRNYGEILAKGRRSVSVWEKELVRLAGDADMPPIARASAIQLLRERPGERFEGAIAKALEDPSAVVRLQSVEAMVHLPPPKRIALGLPRLRDQSRSVRIETARLLAPLLSRKQQSPEDLSYLDVAVSELVESHQAVADVPEGRVGLALFRQSMGDLSSAEAEYQNALRIDPTHVPAIVNLADLYYQGQRLDEAGELLRDGVERSPRNGFLQESLGRHFIRLRDYETGLSH
ncbi:MAG: multiheme c-type cytochrome, partial [Verrucomicrobiota bacterium]